MKISFYLLFAFLFFGINRSLSMDSDLKQLASVNNLIARNNATVDIPKGFFPEIEVNKINSLELTDIITDKVISPIIKGEVIKFKVGKPQQLINFLNSKYCQDKISKSNDYFPSECKTEFYGSGSKTELIVFPIKLKINDQFWNYVLETFSSLSNKKFSISEPHALKIPFLKKCYGNRCDYVPKSLNSRLPEIFSSYFNSSRGSRDYAFTQIGLSPSEDYAISLVNKKDDKYDLFFFKDVLKLHQNDLQINNLFKERYNYSKVCTPLLISVYENPFGQKECTKAVAKYFNQIELKFLDKKGNNVRKRTFDVNEPQFYLKSFNDFCPGGGGDEVRGWISYCGDNNPLMYSLINLKEGIIESEKDFMMFIKLDKETMLKTTSIEISHVERIKDK